MLPNLDYLRPVEKHLIMHLLEEAGMDVSAWHQYSGPAAANPKYCYNWAFCQPGEFVAICLWYDSLELRGSDVVCAISPLDRTYSSTSQAQRIWRRRSLKLREALQTAYIEQLPVRAIIVDGPQGDPKAPNPVASSVTARLLDETPWAVTDFDQITGATLLARGATPTAPASASTDIELSWFEGKMKPSFILHRQREGRLRRAKIADALARNGDRLVCEVVNCGFDFKDRYGSLGEGYAQVHHLLPLSTSPFAGRTTKLSDLAIVCANCHAMIHLGGKCRPLDTLITP